MMEILKLWVRCITAAGQIKQKPIALRQLIILARAAQEYYTSGLYTKDFIDKIRNTHSHPYIYDGTPHRPQGLAKIVTKYNITNSYMHIPESLAGSLSHDISYDIIQKNGDIDYHSTRWPLSFTLQTSRYCDLNPKDGLPLALGQMLARARQK